MRRYTILLTALLFATPAHAQPQRDWSLPEGQSLQQPNISGSMPNNYNGLVPTQNGVSNLPTPSLPTPSAPLPTPYGMDAAPPDDPYTNGPARHFMEGYCDPNFRPAVSNACIEAQKRQSCNTFQQLPAEAQKLLNKVVGCDYIASSSAPGSAPDPSCENNDSLRLQMIRKYERDAMTLHALITLPEDVLHASTNCSRGGR